MNNIEQSGVDYNRTSLINRLTNPGATLEERLGISRYLFPSERKAEMLRSADKDSKGRPVKYFRLVTYKELGRILESGSMNSANTPYLQELFMQQAADIQKSLLQFLQDEGLLEFFEKDLHELSDNFTLENYRNFVQKKLPRIKLFKLHLSPNGGGGKFIGITGLVSLSVGAPYQPPSNPTGNRPGLPVIEMVVPSNEVHVHPLFKTMNIEMEKEVDTTDIKPEWVADVYIGMEDFAERFIKDQGSVLNPLYKEARAKGRLVIDYVGPRDTWDILQNWKRQESIAELIPIDKLKDIDETNPDLQKPLLT